MTKIIPFKSNDLTKQPKSFVTREEVGQLVAEIIRETMNVALQHLESRAQEREGFMVAQVLDELVAKGVLPLLEQSTETQH